MRKICCSLNYYWRIIATGLCFSIFGIGALCLGYLIVPCAFLFAKDKKNKKYIAQYIINLAFRFFVFIMQAFGAMKFEFEDFEKLQSDKGCLIISNHPTLIDYVVIVSRLKRCDIIVKEGLWHNPFLKRIVQVAGYIPNLNSEKTLELIKAALVKGNNVLIFPEGTRTTPGKPLRLKRGTAQIAVRTRTPIRVIKIHCEPVTLTKKSKWYQVPSKKPLFLSSVQDIVKPDEFLKNNAPPSLAARQLTKHLTNILQ